MAIRSRVEYLTAANDQFNIFAGSYISTMGDIAPNVPIARAAIFSAIQQELNPSDFDAARYVAELVNSSLSSGSVVRPRTYFEPVQVANAIKKIKFEELMRRLSDLSGEPSFLDRIIASMYKVRTGSFNLNHLAIAFLISVGHCHTVFTTNFDNAIENACAHLGFAPRVITPDQFPLPLTDNLRSAIVKLHGCAVLGNVVANSTAFGRLQELNSFSTLTPRIAQLPCLFFGYSGTGDIDIAPHIRKVRDPSILIWSNNRDADNPFPGSQTAILDLESVDPDRNFLLALAVKFGWNATTTQSNSDFSPALQRTINTAGGPPYAADALLDLAGLYNPEIHALYWFANERANFIRNDHVFTKDPRMLAIPLNRECLRELSQYHAAPLYQQVWNAFVEWRLGRSSAALQSLLGVLLTALQTSDIGRNALLRAAEIGFGIIAEQMWLSHGRSDGALLSATQAEFIRRAKALVVCPWWGEVETIDRQIKREKRQAEITFRKTGDRRSAEVEMRRLFEMCRDLQLHAEMIGLVHSAWLINEDLGDEFDKARLASPIASHELSAVWKKNFIHKRYNRPLGRLGLYIGERVVPPVVETPFSVLHQLKGRSARADFASWRAGRGI